MAHEELLKKISEQSQTLNKGDGQGYKLVGLGAALHAVVEIHTPREHEVVSYVFCQGCTLDPDLAPPYPCETIQAIEKELK